MASLVNPLVKKPVEVLPCGFFDCNFQIVCLDRLELVFGDVVIESSPEELVAQDKTKHVEHCSATWINVGPVRTNADDRFSSQRGISADASLLTVVHCVIKLISPKRIFIIQPIQVT